MSTRSRIGILNPDGSVDSIYCHFDGYISYNGRILKSKYDTEDKVRALINLGDISSLNETLEETKAESFYVLNKEDIDILHSENETEFYMKGEEYNYLFKDNHWTVDHPREGIIEV